MLSLLDYDFCSLLSVSKTASSFQVLPKNVEEEAETEVTTVETKKEEEDDEGTIYDPMGRKIKSN